MTDQYQPLLSLVPEGAEITGKYLDPADPSRVIVEYIYNDGMVRVTPIRSNIADHIAYDNPYVYYIDGLTYNDVYEIFSNRFGLGLVKGEDYLDNPEVITRLGRISLPIDPLSIKYNPDTLMINIVAQAEMFNGEEKDRNLVGVDFNPFTEELVTNLRSLSSLYIDGRAITCFEGYVTTIPFRDLIISKGNVTDDKLLNEIKSSFVISAFNDGISDVLVMVGPCQIPYSVRFISKDGDIPVFN